MKHLIKTQSNNDDTVFKLTLYDDELDTIEVKTINVDDIIEAKMTVKQSIEAMK